MNCGCTALEQSCWRVADLRPKLLAALSGTVLAWLSIGANGLRWSSLGASTSNSRHCSSFGASISNSPGPSSSALRSKHLAASSGAPTACAQACAMMRKEFVEQGAYQGEHSGQMV
jgi:hypothetical protein